MSALSDGKAAWSHRRILDLLDIEFPILQAPMAGANDSSLAVAVSEAGGLGALPCAMLSPEGVRDEIATIRGRTSRPFSVNFFCHRPPQQSPQREAAWQDRLAPYYDELGLEASAVAAGTGRRSFDDSACELIERLRPPIVSFHFGLPEESLLRRVRA